MERIKPRQIENRPESAGVFWWPVISGVMWIIILGLIMLSW